MFGYYYVFANELCCTEQTSVKLFTSVHFFYAGLDLLVMIYKELHSLSHCMQHDMFLIASDILCNIRGDCLVQLFHEQISA